MSDEFVGADVSRIIRCGAAKRATRPPRHAVRHGRRKEIFSVADPSPIYRFLGLLDRALFKYNYQMWALVLVQLFGSEYELQHFIKQPNDIKIGAE